jgi:hypothetical protein
MQKWIGSISFGKGGWRRKPQRKNVGQLLLKGIECGVCFKDKLKLSWTSPRLDVLSSPKPLMTLLDYIIQDMVKVEPDRFTIERSSIVELSVFSKRKGHALSF